MTLEPQQSTGCMNGACRRTDPLPACLVKLRADQSLQLLGLPGAAVIGVWPRVEHLAVGVEEHETLAHAGADHDPDGPAFGLVQARAGLAYGAPHRISDTGRELHGPRASLRVRQLQPLAI